MEVHDPLLEDSTPSSAEELLARFYDEAELGVHDSVEALCRDHPEQAQILRKLHKDCQQVELLLSLAGDPELEHGFEVQGELGRGSYGQVYRATDRALQREVALKVIGERALPSDTAQARFLCEARTLASLNHSNIVRIHSIDKHDGRLCLSMELIDGQTLSEIVASSGPYSAVEAVRVGIDLARALAAIHARGVVHMDVKAANVMREEGGRIVLLDFGFARALDARAGDPEHPIGGTPLFMSPEQIACDPALGPSSDVYSLGVLLFWMLTRAYPHRAATVDALRMAVLHGDPLRLADTGVDVPGELAAIIEKATARNPDNRHTSAGELERALREFLTSYSGLASPHSDANGAGWRGSRRRLGLAAAATVGLAITGWLWLSGARSLDVDYALYARRGPESEQPVRLSEDERVAVGDRLFLTLQANQPVYVYAFNADEAGNTYGLFPLEDGPLNPLQPDRQHELPGGGGYWEVSESGGGADYVYVIASVLPITEVQQLYEACAKAGDTGLPADGSAQILAPRERGIGKLHRPSPPADAAMHVRAFFADLAQERPSEADVFQLRLANP